MKERERTVKVFGFLFFPFFSLFSSIFAIIKGFKFIFVVMTCSVICSPVFSLVSSASVVGFSGSRSPSSASVAAVREVAGFVSAPVAVGCARGVDAVARELFPSASVLAVSSGRWGSGRGAFAARSSALVRSLVGGGCLLVFPASPCPAGLLPSRSSSRCFGGFGAGSWSTAALALGLGVPVAVFLPPGVPSPLLWGLSSVGGGWFVSAPPAQLSLF